MIEALNFANQPLNGQQISSLNTIMCHVAFRRGGKPETIRKILEEKFGVDDYAKIKQADYQDAIEFLIDLNFEEIRSQK